MEERAFVVCSGASLRMLSGRDFTSAELDTIRVPRHSATVITAHVSSAPNEEATCVKYCASIVTVQLLEDTSGAVPLEKALCEDHGCSYGWKNCKYHILLKMAENTLQIVQIVHLRVEERYPQFGGHKISSGCGGAYLAEQHRPAPVQTSGSGKHNVIVHHPNYEICRRTTKNHIHRAEKFGHLLIVDTNNRQYAVVDKILPLNVLKATNVQPKLHKKRGEAHRSSSIQNPVQR